MKTPVKKTLLQRANDLIYGDREKDYGTPSKNFKDIAEMWSIVLNQPVSPEQVIQMMIALKLCRAINGKSTIDTYTDIAGYAGLIERIDT